MKATLHKKNKVDKVIIVLPTFNERGNIGRLLDAIFFQQFEIDSADISVLVVDDSSPDGTAELVKKYQQYFPNKLHLLMGKKKGLGAAYVRGFSYAVNTLGADIVFEMDADFSHNPNDIPRLIHKVQEGYDLVIGSRYTKGGSIPDQWPLLRKLNSKIGNIFARHLVGLKPIQDCTGGFRAIRASLLKKIPLKDLNVKGYVFVVSLLHLAKKQNARITEIPIHFADRLHGESKLKITDIVEFIFHAFSLRFASLFVLFYFFLFGLLVGTLVPAVIFNNIFAVIPGSVLIATFLILTSLVLILQSIFTIWHMMYAWENPTDIEKNKSPKVYSNPRYSFTALIPARFESNVIEATIRSVARINYPESLKEIIVICRTDDQETINAVNRVINLLSSKNIKLITFSDLPINKPHALNIGLQFATNDVIAVFDAEDEPNKDIYHIVNTVMKRKSADIVQSGVQLMNYKSRWFSLFNVLEYYFWFKSSLLFFAKNGIIPLGGNTVFFKKHWLATAGGWEESSLTEDAEIGIRLSLAGAKTRVVYDENHTTQEETPSSIGSFIKQRTRWNQGFLQILLQGEWLKFPTFTQKILAFYILSSSFLQSVLLLYAIVSSILVFSLKLPIVIVLFSIIPVFLLMFQFLIWNIGVFQFTRDYHLRYPFLAPILTVITFLPYQFLLSFSALRAVYRILVNETNWEKTPHTNAHRHTPTFEIPYLTKPAYRV